MSPPPAAATVAAASTAHRSIFDHSAGPAEFTKSALKPSPRGRLSQSELDEILGTSSKIGPGRPGNLTPFQEAKLRHMWLLACKTFEVYDKPTLDYVASLAPASPPDPNTLNTTDSAVSTSSKKSRGGFFSRKKEEEPAPKPVAAAAAASSSGTLVLPDASDLILDEDKHGANKGFQAAMANYTRAELRQAFWDMCKADHPDALLLRFLRARKWDVNAAFVMAVGALHWRIAEFKVDSELMAGGEALAVKEAQSSDPEVKKEGQGFLLQLEHGKNILVGTDREGRPISIVRVKLHRPADQTATSLERFTVWSIETSRLALRPPVDTGTIVFDMTDFGLANMDYTPVQFIIKCFEANYPESLGAIYIHKAPWIFQGIWKVIRGWLDPVVASKVHFTNTEKDLKESIAPENLHESLKGDLKFAWNYTRPDPRENDKMLDTATRDRQLQKHRDIVLQFEEATVEWVIKSLLLARGDHPEVTQDAVDDALHHRHRLARKMRDQYWVIDPYVRARSIYDRLDVFPTSASANGILRNPK